MEDNTKIKNHLGMIYDPLKGMTFEATYQGEYEMPQTGNERDILVIKRQNPFAATLKEISKAVLNKYGALVWKGITGPEDSARYTDYWLWVEPGALEMGSTYEFNIKKCSVFECSGEFSYGISIRATASRKLSSSSSSDTD